MLRPRVPRDRMPSAVRLTEMFYDLVGSTALSTGMDPEDLRDVFTSFQDRCLASGPMWRRGRKHHETGRRSIYDPHER